ncbi:hypothetical protein D8682_06710 [Buttiauxella sp. 3AFRM03]|uniref:contractile injection system protein, VgrG/Pvc8 family n=1 Tax=Buttiauxella sp. 3AFRM03 TaxID=2479367 RepID=UPI000EF78D17|nr:contractile injection system protein, VgrG/Pvc8 family [Buttiauxella sp. 3AFRM03]AYN26705.1 hypothetical protein D8682_06710 [Buttiauxella sp. 3AFRM03]
MNNVNPYLPTFSLIAEDKNITHEVAKYLTDLTFIDYGATGEDPQSDKLTINLVSPTMMLPAKGAKLKLAVPSSNAIHTHNMPSQKTRSWDNISVGEIVRTIAAENGLLSSISPELNNQMPGHLDQFYENDAEFLAKLARQYDAISKATGGYWVFMVQGSGKSASGKDLPAVTITPDGKTSWQFPHRSKARSPSAAVAGNKGTYVVLYNDAETNETKELKYGSGDPTTTSGRTLPNLAAAEQLIRSHQQTEARITANARQTKTKPEHLMFMSIAQPATPELLALMPESSVTTEGFDPQADRSWIVDNIAFSLSPGKGMSVSMELKR